MSEELQTIIGKKEYIRNTTNKEVGYHDAELRICSFYGGKERGGCIQLDLGSEHIQLDRDSVMQLRNELDLWLSPSKEDLRK